MIKAIFSDFARVICFLKDTSYRGKLSDLYDSLRGKDVSVFNHYTLNHEYLRFLHNLKKQHDIALYIFTSGKMHLDDEILSITKSLFDDQFSALDFASSKSEKESYLLLAGKLNLQPADILFIDDREHNIEAAKQAGLATIHYLNNADAFEKIQDLVS
ncbi:HAD-IA family hydrolase [Candidatus Woesebacteria bacterium]|nr:HAD-IA family hydrolase [Candidatus Woesebacteria bacterium]